MRPKGTGQPGSGPLRGFRGSGSRGARRGRGALRGFTLVELVFSLLVVGIITGIAVSAYREYSRATAVEQAAGLLAEDVSRTRALAIQRREAVSLVPDEANRTYTIRNSAGTVFAARDLGSDSDLPLTLLDLAPLDSLTFNARGILRGTSAATVDVARLGRTRRVTVNALGRVRVASP